MLSRLRPLPLVFLLGGCTTFNLNTPQPSLQTLNGGQSSCVMDCHMTQTATQSIGEGDVDGGTVKKTSTRTTNPPPVTMPLGN